MDVVGGVGWGDEGGLALRGCEENVAVEHFAEEARGGSGVGAFCSRVIVNGLIGEKYRAEGIAGIYLRSHASLRDGFAQAGDKLLGVLIDALVQTGRS